MRAEDGGQKWEVSVGMDARLGGRSRRTLFALLTCNVVILWCFMADRGEPDVSVVVWEQDSPAGNSGKCGSAAVADDGTPQCCSLCTRLFLPSRRIAACHRGHPSTTTLQTRTIDEDDSDNDDDAPRHRPSLLCYSHPLFWRTASTHSLERRHNKYLTTRHGQPAVKHRRRSAR